MAHGPPGILGIIEPTLLRVMAEAIGMIGLNPGKIPDPKGVISPAGTGTPHIIPMIGSETHITTGEIVPTVIGKVTETRHISRGKEIGGSRKNQKNMQPQDT